MFTSALRCLLRRIRRHHRSLHGICPARRTTTAVLSACCNEESIAVNCGTPWCRATRRLAAITWHGREIPKLTINRRCLWQASAPGWPKARPESGEPPAARVSHHVGSEGIADQGQGSERRPPTRRDTHLRTLMSCDRYQPRTSSDLVSCPSRARSLGDSRGTTDNNGQNVTDSAPEHFPAHRPL